ncbi:hypothetical protein M0R45_036859 [Rubus argutus]|uniref:Uncharacterized protein n=1 Tax=Rubus argutus TaxID=59490 RepID=A0AAW1VXK8_RUBAR
MPNTNCSSQVPKNTNCTMLRSESFINYGIVLQKEDEASLQGEDEVISLQGEDEVISLQGEDEVISLQGEDEVDLSSEDGVYLSGQYEGYMQGKEDFLSESNGCSLKSNEKKDKTEELCIGSAYTAYANYGGKKVST